MWTPCNNDSNLLGTWLPIWLRSPIWWKALFSAPRDGNRLAEWNRQIPRQGTLTPKHRLCDLHFEDRFITKSDDFTIKGQRISFPRTVWRLTDDAVPTVFPNLPQYLSRLNMSSNFVHNSSKRMTSPTKGAWLWSHDCRLNITNY